MVSFDPYHKWLGIPPEQQPPNLYCLLGLPMFESDSDVINAAAERQTIYLRTFQTGDQAELAEQLLKEVSTARICLLNPRDKGDYDQQLHMALTKQPMLKTPMQTDNSTALKSRASASAGSGQSLHSKPTDAKKSPREPTTKRATDRGERTYTSARLPGQTTQPSHLASAPHRARDVHGKFPVEKAVAAGVITLVLFCAFLGRGEILTWFKPAPNQINRSDRRPAANNPVGSEPSRQEIKPPLPAITPFDAKAAETGFRPLFDGKTLEGWDGNPAFWSVQDGAITGQTTKQKPTNGNTFIIWRGGKTGDFELRLQFRIVGGNSGIQYRSKEVSKWVMAGYQADFDGAGNWTGTLFEEKGRGILAKRGTRVTVSVTGEKKTTGRTALEEEILAAVKKEDWNDYTIIAEGNHLVQILNGETTIDLVDNQKDRRTMSGLLALQLHAGLPMTVQFRNIRIRESTKKAVGSKPLPPPVAPFDTTQAKRKVDLLGMLKPSRDFLDSRIQLKNGVLLTPKWPNNAIVMIPYEPVPEEYDINIQLERKGYDRFGFDFGIVMGGKQALISMDGSSKPAWCLHRIDGLSIHDDDNPTRKLGKRLHIGRRSDVTIRIRFGRVTVLLNDETIIDWKGRPEQFTLWDALQLPDSRSLFFFSQAEFVIHELTLTPRSSR